MEKKTWNEWSIYVLKELEDLNRRVEALVISDHLKDIEITKLNDRVTRSAFLWSVIGGVVTLTVGLIIYFLTKGGN